MIQVEGELDWVRSTIEELRHKAAESKSNMDQLQKKSEQQTKLMEAISRGFRRNGDEDGGENSVGQKESDQSGLAYIQTMNLDGESNLKTRYARQETAMVVASEACDVFGVIRCEQPNRNIYEFTANMEFNGLKFSLSQSNIVLRGCQL